MAFVTCFVIITGVLIWLEARNKKNVHQKYRRFNEALGYTYLAVCLSMFPVTALAMNVSKLLPDWLDDQRKHILNSVYFGGWLLLSLFFRLKENNYFTAKYVLLIGGILGLCIPLINGLSSGKWLWKTFEESHYDIFFTDFLWFLLAMASLLPVFKMRREPLKY